MTAYIGSIGMLIGLWSTPTAQIESEEVYSFKTTLEGNRKAQVRPVGRRRWSLNAGLADASEQAAITDFASGAWGLGPFWFLPPDALVGNCLSPEVVDLKRLPTFTGYDNVTIGGPVATPDGVAPVSMHNDDLAKPGFFTLDHTPVIGGQPVVVSAYVAGAGARVQVHFYDAAGTYLSMVESSIQSTGGMVRSWIQWTAPASAVSCRVATFNATVSTRPALTFTDELMDWTSGRGCPQAVLHGAGQTLNVAGRNGIYSDVSYTITEVG